MAVNRVVQHRIRVGEDFLGGDAVLPGDVVEIFPPLLQVVFVDEPQPPLGDVTYPLAVGSVAVSGEALGFLDQVMAWWLVGRDRMERLG